MAAFPNTAEVRIPQVKILASGESTDSISISWNLPASTASAGFPTLKYSLHKPEGQKVISPTAAELIAKVAALQTKIFSNPDKKEIEVSDGDYNKFKFVGFDTSAHHEVMFGKVNNGGTIVHPCAKLSKLNTSIYAGLPTSVKDKVTLDFTTIPEAMKVVLQALVDNFEENIEISENISEDQKAVNRNVHAVNKAIIKDYWETVLEATDNVTFDGFSEFVAETQNAEQLVAAIEEVYISATEDFFIKIDQFCSMFQMLFIPDYNYMLGVGKFISYKDIIKNGEEKSINIISIGMSCGDRSFFPSSAVIMKGVPSVSIKSGLPTTYEASVAGWPETIPDTSFINFISIPAWIPSEIDLPRNLIAAKETTLEPETYESTEAARDEEMATAVNKIYKVCKDFCRTYYSFSLLSSSSVVVSTLLDLTWEPGKRYAVFQAGGEKLFDGFLRSVEHRISSSRDGASATTQLIFAWVEANGFVLPNK